MCTQQRNAPSLKATSQSARKHTENTHSEKSSLTVTQRTGLNNQIHSEQIECLRGKAQKEGTGDKGNEGTSDKCGAFRRPETVGWRGAFMSDFPPLRRPRKTQTGKAPQTPAWGSEQRAPGSLNPSRSHTGRSGPASGSGPAWGRESPSVPAASSRPGTNPDHPTRGTAPVQTELAARWPRPDSSCRDRTGRPRKKILHVWACPPHRPSQTLAGEVSVAGRGGRALGRI